MSRQKVGSRTKFSSRINITAWRVNEGYYFSPSLIDWGSSIDKRVPPRRASTGNVSNCCTGFLRQWSDTSEIGTPGDCRSYLALCCTEVSQKQLEAVLHASPGRPESLTCSSYVSGTVCHWITKLILHSSPILDQSIWRTACNIWSVVWPSDDFGMCTISKRGARSTKSESM